MARRDVRNNKRGIPSYLRRSDFPDIDFVTMFLHGIISPDKVR